MTISAVSICSNALLLNGDAPIDSFDESNDRTRLMVNLFESKRRKVLRMHPWNCAIKRVVLSPNVLTTEEAANLFGWAYVFNLPGDWLRTLSVGVDDAPEDYVEESRQIKMDSSVCRLRYVWDNANPATWDSLLVDAMTEVMKAATSYAITKSTSKTDMDERIVRDVLKTARSVDGQSGSPETFGDSPLLANRMR